VEIADSWTNLNKTIGSERQVGRIDGYLKGKTKTMKLFSQGYYAINITLKFMKTYSCFQTLEISNSPLYWITRLPLLLLREWTKPLHLLLSTVPRYQKRISSLISDRIDINVEIPRVDNNKLSDDRSGEPS
jgi:hypothetical protein